MESQWEVYETNDDEIGEIETKANVENEASVFANPDIDGSKCIKPEKAFEVFCGKRYVQPPDLARDIAKLERPRYELGGALEPNSSTLESPYEKYNRLRIEVEELVNALSLDEDFKRKSGNDYYEILANNVKELNDKLLALKEHKALDPKSYSVISEEKDFRRKLKEDFAMIEKAASTAGSQQESMLDAGKAFKNEAGAAIKYELYYSKQQSNSLQVEEMARLEKRIYLLEQAMGIQKDAKSDLNGYKSFVQRIALVEKKVKCFDEAALDIIARKTAVLNKELETLSKLRQKGGALPVSDATGVSVNQINVMYDRLESCDNVASIIDPLIERLETLQDVHHHNASYHDRLSLLEKAQNDIRETLSFDKALLQNVSAGLQQNIKVLFNHFDVICEKINKRN